MLTLFLGRHIPPPTNPVSHSYALLMSAHEPFRFEFIRTLCPHLSEEELGEADRNFAAYLDVMAEIVEQRRGGDNRFGDFAPAPYDSIPPVSGV
ncbi:MAG: hypothetical protein ABL907_08530 [Hyphomicrobium sp.]